MADASPNDNIPEFIQRVREDSGLQAQIVGEVAHAAPEVLVTVAAKHGFSFTAEEVKQFSEDRALRSLQGVIFWDKCRPCPQIEKTPVPSVSVAFCQICGPTWVQEAPYRKALPTTAEEVATSLSDLFREIKNETQ